MRTGETYVYGHDRNTARALLIACDKAGVGRHVVRATETGFIVPDEVWDVAEQDLAPVLDAEAVF